MNHRPDAPDSDPGELQPLLVPGLDALTDWRLALSADLDALTRFLVAGDLLSPSGLSSAMALRQRLSSDKLVVAFVAEFSRGKSELINAIFFADAGQRVLPATPGRTTMCPVELSWDERELPTLDLLPIDSRRESQSLAEWRHQRERWRRVQLDPGDLAALSQALVEVTATRHVSVQDARELGLWSDESGADNPPLGSDGQVEVPAWRHAIINFPHPLLQRGLVVVDTPGLNAIGAEPELTLGLLPSAHAALFVLGADTGVTRSDLDVWTQHLGGQGMSCFVVLNKMDTLADPLASEAELEAAIERQCRTTAETLRVDRGRVFPVSARMALTARMDGDARRLAASRLPALEAALTQSLLPQRQSVLAKTVIGGVQSLLEHATRRLRDQRRHNAEQMLELRGLRGKSQARVNQMLERVRAETTDFDRCNSRLSALRAVHARMLREALHELSADQVRQGVAVLQQALGASWFGLRARAAFGELCSAMVAHLERSVHLCTEIAQMLEASFGQLNAEYGFSLAMTPPPDLAAQRDELLAIERGYARYFGVSRVMHLDAAGFNEQLQRMLTSKLRTVMEGAQGEVDTWNQGLSSQIDGQYRERRRSYKRRTESLERIVHATGELERRLAEVEGQDQQLLSQIDQAYRLGAQVCERAEQGPAPVLPGAESPPPPSLMLVRSDGAQVRQA